MLEKNKIINQSVRKTGVATGEKSGFYSVLLFICWPLLSLAAALKNYRKPWSKNIFWAFCVFYGFTFAIGAESLGKDITGYISSYQEMYGHSMSINQVISYFAQSGEIDILSLLISYVLSRFTDSAAILTMVYGAIFGFFLSRNIWFLLNRMKGKLLPISLLLLTCFFLINPIWNLNGFRMWTAAHVFIYGLLLFMIEGKWKGAGIAALSILVHYAFIVPVCLLIAYVVLGNRLTIYFVFFAVTFFISEINLEILNEAIDAYAPQIVQERTAGYRSEAYVESYRAEEEDTNKNWYVELYGKAFKWVVVGFLSVLFFRGRDFFDKNKEWLRLYSFILLFYGVANLMSSIPSGGRYIAVVNLGALSLIIYFIQNYKFDVYMKRFLWAALPALLLFIIVSFRFGLYSMSPTSMFGNPLIALFISGDYISLNDVLKMLI